MTKEARAQQKRCTWCMRPLPAAKSTGRPRLFCRDSCRMRSFRARQLSERVGISADQAVVALAELQKLGDLIYQLECALDDARGDLEEAGIDVEREGGLGEGEVGRVLVDLYRAATPLAGFTMDPAER